MSCDLLFNCTLVLILATVVVQTTAYVSILSSSDNNKIFKSALDMLDDVMPKSLYDESHTTTNGKIVFRPHQDFNELNERPVYDPGDELMRALNEDAAKSSQIFKISKPDNGYDGKSDDETANAPNMLRKLHQDLEDEQDLVTKSAILIKMLEDPTLDTLPIVYVEEDELNDNLSNESTFPVSINSVSKRSRYYRRYPWKRHNKNRSNYDPELRYACTPSKEDVFKLLVNLHENRNGRNGKTISFCNRKRPARAIFTNIRFLG